MKNLMELSSYLSTKNATDTREIADGIIEAAVIYGKLAAGKVTAFAFDKQAGSGQNISVRIFPSRTAQIVSGTAVGGQCFSVASTTISVATVTINRLGDYDLLHGLAFWAAPADTQAAIMNEMAKGVAYKQDQQIIWSMCTAGTAPTYHCYSNVSVTSTASYGVSGVYKYNLYESVVSQKATMAAAGYHPDVIIMNPTVAARLKIASGLAQYPQVTLDADGNLTSLAGLRVIETPAAPTAATTGKATFAILIDSSRAVAEAWGMHPTFETQRVPDCDETKLVLNTYWGCHLVQSAAIGHICNP